MRPIPANGTEWGQAPQGVLRRGERSRAWSYSPRSCLFSPRLANGGCGCGTLAVVAAIFASLGVGGQLAEALRDLEALDEALQVGLFLLCMLLVGTTAVLQGRVDAAGPAGAGGGGGRRRGVPDGVPPHRGAGGAFAPDRVRGAGRVRVRGPRGAGSARGRRVPAPAVLAIAGTSAVGLLDECLQVWVPNRVFDPWDILFNVLAASMAVGASGRAGVGAAAWQSGAEGPGAMLMTAASQPPNIARLWCFRLLPHVVGKLRRRPCGDGHGAYHHEIPGGAR